MTTTQVRADALAERPLAGTEQATVRPATQADLAAVQAIYASHVLGGTGSFEEVPPSLGEIEARWRGITGGGLPYLVAAEGERLLGFAYAGGFTTRHYGRPGDGVHALQIEINRALYMDERRIARLPSFADTAARIGRLITALAGMNRALFSAR